MKIRAFSCALFLLALPVVAQNNGQAANGNFQFNLEGASGAIQFDARLQGTAKGNLTFTSSAAIPNEDVDGEGLPAGDLTPTFTVSLDCVLFSGNKAAMSGVVTSSNVSAYVGRRALLAVEDNGEGVNQPAPDRFSWGLYQTIAPTWVPSDADVPGDNGAFLSWSVDDSEIEDDTPVPSTPLNLSSSTNCNTFRFDLYGFAEIPHGGGNVQVKP